MDNFKIIYKILKMFERAMDLDEFDTSEISAEALGISQNRLNSILEMMIESGYISGCTIVHSIMGGKGIKFISPRITLRGIEYLEENTLMKKAANVVKGIKDTIPGL